MPDLEDVKVFKKEADTTTTSPSPLTLDRESPLLVQHRKEVKEEEISEKNGNGLGIGTSGTSAFQPPTSTTSSTPPTTAGANPLLEYLAKAHVLAAAAAQSPSYMMMAAQAAQAQIQNQMMNALLMQQQAQQMQSAYFDLFSRINSPAYPAAARLLAPPPSLMSPGTDLAHRFSFHSLQSPLVGGGPAIGRFGVPSTSGGLSMPSPTYRIPSMPSPSMKRKHTPEQHIKKPRNCYFVYMDENRAKLKALPEFKDMQSAELNKILGDRWQALPEAEKTTYMEKAKKEFEEHKLKYPGWSNRDNYAQATKAKKKKRDPAELALDEEKKCRARFGMDNTDKWCKSCTRKKKCSYLTTGAGEGSSISSASPDVELTIKEEEEDEDDGIRPSSSSVHPDDDDEDSDSDEDDPMITDPKELDRVGVHQMVAE